MKPIICDKQNIVSQQIYSALFGVAVGDALGVPVEFLPRSHLKEKPVSEMLGYGTYNLPEGTWSDDSSLTFCLAEALCDDFNLDHIAQVAFNWLNEGYWTPYGEVFDVGMATRKSLFLVPMGIPASELGQKSERDNGNGSLMRILPLLFFIQNRPLAERFQFIQQVSSITHAHIRSIIACFYYLEFARYLLQGEDKKSIYQRLQKEIPEYLRSVFIEQKEINHFSRLLNEDITQCLEQDIQSSGYVVHSLEASIWCLMTTNNYAEAVLKAVNLGEDTDTTAAITGGLAGILYGIENIPENWLNILARKNDIESLCNRFANKINNL
ncbi:ADP-ribosylglycohydrolase family protein [Muribacter muris]|uniref:ADP-ribosylglycohydrolase family protein n=1 Tax=Muribacter muris TaxID=67855 RepID=A0A4Y9K3A5_9PAST|nr:ADP-ribosylglycohydrolase family protein [Muribacter muris]MBF0784752.1 ADP-ribosylglycohydrolase family protein [Muribacter muris]MBF0827801.1 ADP-ribosylglycohydrolase family protein [Muribacter muris]TFV11175.1 ADP-ribosylglycohydrolase family protein [Muribacter muris]